MNDVIEEKNYIKIKCIIILNGLYIDCNCNSFLLILYCEYIDDNK